MLVDFTCICGQLLDLNKLIEQIYSFLVIILKRTKTKALEVFHPRQTKYIGTLTVILVLATIVRGWDGCSALSDPSSGKRTAAQ